MGSLVIWVIHICWLASGPSGEKFQWNLPYYFHISHLLPLVFKILPFTYFYSPRLLESGGHRKGMTNEVRCFKHTDMIHFDFYTFLVDTRTIIHIGAILLDSVLYGYM